MNTSKQSAIPQPDELVKSKPPVESVCDTFRVYGSGIR